MAKRDVNPLVEARLEDAALADYREYLGRIILVHVIDAGWTEPDGDEPSDTGIRLDPPLRCRVVPTPEYDVLRWTCCEWLDPLWDVRPLHAHPRLPGLRWAQVSGIRSYSTSHAPTTTREWTLEPEGWFGRLRRRFLRLLRNAK